MMVHEEQVKRIIYEVLPEYIKTHPEVREYLRDLLERCPYREKSEDRFEKLLMELKQMREESERRWRENQEEIKRLREESEKKWEESERRWRETQEEIKRLREESEKKWEESEKRWRETQEEIKRLREESERRWRENQEEIKRLREESEKKWEETQKEIKRLHRLYDVGVGALGARWGLQAESTFRNAIKGILEESFPVKVERYLAKDEEGEVFGRPDQIELDLIIKDGEVIAGEIKSSMSKSDVYTFDKKVKFYEKRKGRKVKRKLIISPMVEDQAKEVAKELGIEVYTYPDYIEKL